MCCQAGRSRTAPAGRLTGGGDSAPSCTDLFELRIRLASIPLLISAFGRSKVAVSTTWEADLYTYGVQCKITALMHCANVLFAKEIESIKDALQSEWSARVGANECGHVLRRGAVGGGGGLLALQECRGAGTPLIQRWGGRSHPGSAAASNPQHCS